MTNTNYKIAVIFLSVISVSLLYYSITITDFESSHELNPSRNHYEIPDWVRNNAAWWSEDYISTPEFGYALDYLIREGVIEVFECEGQCNEYAKAIKGIEDFEQPNG